MIQRKIDNYLADFYVKHKNALLDVAHIQNHIDSAITEK